MSTPPTDMDIMLFLDGELSGAEAQAVEAYLEANQEAGDKGLGLGEVGELVRGSLELEADAADAKLSALWKGIEEGIAKEEAPAAEVAATPEPARPARKKVQKSSGGLGEWFRNWMSGWQSHVATGAFAAAAVALFMWTTRPERVIEKQTTIRQVAPPVAPVAQKAQAPVVEKLEVYEGSGMVMTIPDEDEDSEGSTAVIWISNDTDVIEDPI